MKFHFKLLSSLLALLTFNHLSAETSAPIQPGDRVAFVGNTFAAQLRNHGCLETLLLNAFEEEALSFRNLGWAGDTLTVRDRPTNFPTEKSTLIEHETDLIIACFGLSESFAGEAGIDNFKQDLKAFIQSHRGQSYNDESEVRLIFVSPIAYENLGNLTPNWKKRNQDLKSYSQAMMNVAVEEVIPFIDLFNPTSNLFEDEAASRFTTNGIHLNDFGYWSVSNLIYKQLMAMISRVPEPWTLRIDAKTGAVRSNGVELSRFTLDGQNFSFDVKEESSPSLPPPLDPNMPAELSAYRDSLVIENLEPGEYTLMVDGKPVATATHEEWAEGVPIDSSPAHREAEDYRAEVIDKNTQFIYSWKALNQVHIVGERRNSSSGRALPQEVIEFNKLTKEKDASLQNGLERKTREWQLVPDTKLTN